MRLGRGQWEKIALWLHGQCTNRKVATLIFNDLYKESVIGFKERILRIANHYTDWKPGEKKKWVARRLLRIRKDKRKFRTKFLKWVAEGEPKNRDMSHSTFKQVKGIIAKHGTWVGYTHGMVGINFTPRGYATSRIHHIAANKRKSKIEDI